MKHLSLAQVLDKMEAGSYVFERFVYRSIDKMPKGLQDSTVNTVGKLAKNTGHAVRVVVEKTWQRWGP